MLGKIFYSRTFATLAPLVAVFLGLLCLGVIKLDPWTLSLAGGLAGMTFLMKDTALKVTKALPNGAASTTSDGIDLMTSTRGDMLAQCEVLITAPALTTTELGDTQTITYILEHDDDSAFGTVATLLDKLIVQTGAGGAGSAGATKYVRLPVDTKRYIRLKTTKTGASNASTSSSTTELVF